MSSKSLEEIKRKIENINFKERFDMVVGIGRGGIVPSFLVSKNKNLDLEMIWIKYRDEENKIIFKKPKLIKKTDFDSEDKNILLVDDVSRSGATFQKAKDYLREASLIRTFVINGEGDYNLYNEKCFVFPWSL